MSIARCPHCDETYDQDFNVEHKEDCASGYIPGSGGKVNKPPNKGNKSDADVNKPSWQTELDRVFGQLFEGQPVMTGSIRPKMIAFIQDLLNRKAREIEGLKFKGDVALGWGELTGEEFAYNKALNQALSILKEE